MTRRQGLHHKSNDAKFYGITRYSYGWAVQLTRGGVRHVQNFSDRACGGREAGLCAAQRWRDEMLVRRPPPPRRERAQKPRPRSTPGTAGVTFELGKDGSIKLWRAKTYVAPGRVLQKTFSVRQWGAQAETLARMERARHLELMEGLCHVHPAEPELRKKAQDRTEPAVVPLPAHPAAEVLRVTNSSGFPGVVRRGRPPGPVYWTAQSTHRGRWISRSFSVQKYGEEVALILAIMERLDQRRDFAAQDQASG